MKLDKKSLKLYAVTDRAWIGDQTLAEQVQDAISGGVTIVQLREKRLSHESFVQEAFKIKAICKDVPFIINDNVEVAKIVGADGVHIGQDDMSVKSAREIIGDDKIVGVSVQTVKQAQRAQREGADYLGVGAMFSTSTKEDAKLVTLQTLQEICQTVSIPVVAIGGITLETIPEVVKTDIAGIAVVSAIFAQENIKEATREILALLKTD